ncbi:MAG: hypothetical protein HYS07_05500 [Chlamydiae bacterium]|nr:hypothetical protein [Chlamydiota bacterium]
MLIHILKSIVLGVMVAASGYSLLKHHSGMTGHESILLATGFVVAFLTAFGMVRFLIHYVQNHDFKLFGYYRIVLGLLILGSIAWAVG